MGTFYQYFKNKDQVFLELNDLIISRFSAKAQSLDLEGISFEERLRKVLNLLYRHTRNNFAFHRILGESELIDRVTIAYYESIARYYRDFLRAEGRAGNIRLLDANMLAYGLIGICYFNSLDWGTGDERFEDARVLDLMLDLVQHGISGTSPWKKLPKKDLLTLPDPLPLISIDMEPTSKGERTRMAIFRSAERTFGRQGINRANIAEITREAGVAQGTFYIHFESKADLIEGFVKYINHEMRREIERHAGRMEDRRDAERVGMLSFFRFVRKHKEAYRLVPECEMINREVALWYYRKLAHGYIHGLNQGIRKKEIRDLPVVLMARSLMGFIHFVSLKWIIWNTNPSADIPEQTARDIVQFVLFGLKGGES
jgi:AcrR family transcriptional regulator